MKADQDDIGSKTKRGFVWDMLGSFARQLVSFVISITLARLLLPEQFGLIGMAMVFVSFSQVFVDVGFTQGLIQRKNVSDAAYSSVFYMNLAISLCISLLIFLCAPLIGKFYDSKEVSSVLKYLALIPAIAALGKVHAAILVKRFDFKMLAIRNIVAILIGGVVGVVAALQGEGVYSLVWQQLVTIVIDTLLLWVGSGWRPKQKFSWNEVQSLFAFSSFIFLDQLFRQIFNKIDTLFIGKFFSPAILGYYTRAESLNSQIKDYTSNSIRKVAFPLFSKLQDDAVSFKSYFLRIFRLGTVAAVFIGGILYFIAAPLILGLLGEKWAQTIPIFRILVFLTFTAPHIGLIGKALQGKGYSKLKFKLGLVHHLLKIIPLVLGYFYGIIVFSYGIVFVSVLYFLINVIFVDRFLSISAWQQVLSFLYLLLPFLFIVGITSFTTAIQHPFLITSLFVVSMAAFLIITKDESISIVRRLLVRV